jgi:hypothetical protein
VVALDPLLQVLGDVVDRSACQEAGFPGCSDGRRIGASCVRTDPVGCYGLFSKPDPDRSELDEGEIALRQLVVAGGNPPVLLQAPDQPLNHVALVV